jgi:hypothetical protein
MSNKATSSGHKKDWDELKRRKEENNGRDARERN